MPQDLSIDLPETVTVFKPVGATLRGLVIERADASSPGKMKVALAPLDANGNWREDVTPKQVSQTDDLDATNPRERFAASMFHELMFTAICADNATNRALGVVGDTVWDAAKKLLPSFLNTP